MATIEQAARFDKAAPRPGDRILENYGPGHMATWKTAGKVLAVLDGGQCIVVRRYSPRTGHQYQAIHRIEWCVLPFEICPNRPTRAPEKPNESEACFGSGDDDGSYDLDKPRRS